MTTTRRIAVITGTRAEFGLLRPVLRVIEAESRLSLQLLVTGVHLLPPSNTIDEVAAEFDIAGTVPMQTTTESAVKQTTRHGAPTLSHSQERENVAVLEAMPATTSRSADSAALGRGVAGLAACFAELEPQCVLVLGDRIEAFAAAAAASVAGIRVVHMHGGDRAEGIADESLRHAITKLAHIHLPATTVSAQRIIAMGEQPQRVHVVGSPAIDGLEHTPAMSDAEFTALGKPRAVVLLHPMGRDANVERTIAQHVFSAAKTLGPILVLHPNHDPGREGIISAIESSGCTHRAHLPRPMFIGLLKRVQAIIGNSSAGLIECAALGVRAVNIGHRQRGRERAGNVVDLPDPHSAEDLIATLRKAIELPRPAPDTTFGDGQTGPRVAQLLATFDERQYPVAKCNTY